MKLYSLDTETTGLHWQHGISTFAIGLYSEDGGYHSWIRDINPLTRKPYSSFSSRTIRTLRNHFDDSNRTTVFQNANFDVKAMCEVGVFDWRDPSRRDFWDRILELGHLMHLHDSTDAKSHSSLKVLTPRYLGRSYDSEEELDRIVIRCRTFIERRRPKWKIAGPRTTPTSTKKWHKADMWLPETVLREYPDAREISKYFKEDAAVLGTVVAEYLKDDCRNTLDLAVGFLSELVSRHTEEEYDRLSAMNRNLFPVIWDMETLGVSIHKTRLQDSIAACCDMIDRITETCLDFTGDRPLTPANLRIILFEEMGLEPVSWTEKTRQPQVNIPSLWELRGTVSDSSPPAKFLSNLL